MSSKYFEVVGLVGLELDGTFTNVTCGRDVPICRFCRILSWRTWCLTGLEMLSTGAHWIYIEYMQCRNGSFGLLSLSFLSLYQVPSSVSKDLHASYFQYKLTVAVRKRPQDSTGQCKGRLGYAVRQPISSEGAEFYNSDHISALIGPIFFYSCRCEAT